MSTASKILKEIKDKEVQYVDLRFTDTKGRLQHVTFDIDLVDEDFLTEGTMFDGSSIAGWKAINESDMLLMPDLSTAYIDPFYQQTTLFLFCDVLNPDTQEPYSRDSRSMAKKALAYVQSSGVGDAVYFGPEAEFFIFDDVRWSTQAHDTGYTYDSIELPANTGAEYSEGNMGHRPGPKGGYFPVNPVDSGQDLRGEMLAVMRDLGLNPEKHHHEVAPAQHELGMKFSTLVAMADNMQLYKYIVHNVANATGVIAAASALGLPRDAVARGIAGALGAGRRFDRMGEAGGIDVYDDYAHHPTEVRATLAAARARFPGRRIVVCFQPHTEARTRYLFAEFRSCFAAADALVVLDTFAARHTGTEGESAETLARAIERPAASYAATHEAARDAILAELRTGDVLFTMGAGDVDRLGPMILDALRRGGHG